MYTPIATYRLQLNRFFNLNQATELVDYYADLGISDCYLSPLTQAVPGSLHGYDVTGYRNINPEIGIEATLKTFSEKLNEKKMGAILDIVPNHMCIADLSNTWWKDVLEHGQSSSFSNHFAIHWGSGKKEGNNRVLLPILDCSYEEAIASSCFSIVLEKGEFFIDYNGRRLPIHVKSWGKVLWILEKSLVSPKLQELMGEIQQLDLTNVLHRSRHKFHPASVLALIPAKPTSSYRSLQDQKFQ